MRPRNHENTKTKSTDFRFVPSWFRGFLFLLMFAVSLTAQSATTRPVTYNGLEMSVATLERAPTASLKDCPPGGNTVNATTRPGEEFAIVTVKFKVLPEFKENTILKRPTVTDAAGKTYNTAVSFVDVAKVPEFSCSIPFRVPAGTNLKSFHVDTASLDLTAVDSKK
jgi:hypothetical protein